MEVPALRRNLLAWYDERKRDLPWRDRGDAYAVWISEVMLQQTRVETVRPYFDAWMARFPTLAALAAADEEEVLAAWSGLGYYTRACNLHKAAQVMVKEHGGRLPEDVDALAALPGIGAYTAGAVASIAFGIPAPAVDGNVQRVVSRWCAITDDVGRSIGRGAVADAAAVLVDPQRPGDWNQAVMELGALVCTPTPRCNDCPVTTHCQARRRGIQDGLPVRAAKAPPREEAVHFALVMGDGRLLLVKRPDDGLLGGTWALPGGDRATPLGRLVADQVALQVQVSDSAARTRHVFTHRVWDMHVHTAHVLDVEPREAGLPVQWVPLNRLNGVGLSTAMRKALAAAGLPVG